MWAGAARIFCVSVLILVSLEQALAQRGNRGGGFHGRGGYSVTRGHVPSLAPQRRAFDRSHGVHRHRPSRVNGAIAAEGEGYRGRDDCVFESRLVWNGWATMRELVTVCD